MKPSLEKIPLSKDLEEVLSQTSSFVETMMKDYIASINKEKERIIKELIVQKGYGRFLEPNPNDRFKRILFEIDPEGRESVYVDDGTPSGTRIVTFEVMKNNLSNDVNESMKINLTVDYF